MKSFREALQGRLYMDGGTGSTLLLRGYAQPHPELLNIEKPEVVEGVHRSFFEAGSQCVVTNTFGCNSKKADCSKYSLAELIHAAVKNARSAAQAYGGYVLYDCGPTGGMLEPNGEMTFEEAYELFAEQARIVAHTDVDGVIIETVADLQEMRAAYLAFRENTDFSVVCSMTFEKNGRSFTGTSVESFAMTMQALGADAIGMNCGSGPQEMYKNAVKMMPYVHVPMFVQPNAGLPRYKDGKTVYDLSAEEFAEEVKKIALAGVNVLGGCCGTAPEYIRALVERTKAVPARPPRYSVDGVCSYAQTVVFDGKSKVIGERVNPTGKPLLKQAILADDYDYILSVCASEAEEGADILDINLGMAGCDETVKLPKAVEFVQGRIPLPLCVDTAKGVAMEKAVRRTCGRCIVNSVNGSQKVMDTVFPVVQKYGCYLVALCLDENGIPDTADGRIAVARRILAEGEKYGIGKERFLFDPLTMAVGVDAKNGLLTLETLQRLREELGVKTTLGLSNVSFGLPNRQIINGTFYQMALDRGTTSAIINPSLRPSFTQEAYDLLCGKDEGCARYLEKFGTLTETAVKKELLLADCIERGLTGEAMKIVGEKVNADNFAVVIDRDVIGGLNALGKKYSEGKLFLPQLMAGSETAKAVLDELKKKYLPEGTDAKATVILATVRGDVHDIGKNIVKAVVSNYGYRIIDLGKDVPEEEILAATEKYRPLVVGLSALMTTTLDSMTSAAEKIRRRYPNVTVMVGGAVVTEEFASSIGAVYSRDAREMAMKVEKLFSEHSVQ